MKNDIAAIRQDYVLARFHETDAHENPVTQFEHWFQDAVHAAIDDVNAMTLATVDKEGNPHARIVLLKGIEQEEFIFFTNYNSHKGRQIESNPVVSLVFYWKELQRQVRLCGTIKKISEEASTVYFHSRPVESQIGAWASQQSEILPNREILEIKEKELREKYAGQIVPRPPHWGGYAISPLEIEFWQGRASRLHDRILYTRQNDGHWTKVRLNP